MRIKPLMFCISLCCLSFSVSAQPPQQELRDIKQAINNAQTDLKQKQAAAQRAQAALRQSTDALEKARKELLLLNREQGAVWSRLQKLQGELERIKTEVAGTKAQVVRLLAGHYKNRQPNSIGLFLKNAEPGQKSRYLQYVRHINQANEKAIQNLTKQQDELAGREKAIDAELARLKKLKSAKQAVVSKLGQAQSEAKKQSAALTAQIDGQSKKITRLRADEQRLNGLLAAISRRSAAGKKSQASIRKKAAKERLARSGRNAPRGNLTAEDRALAGPDQSQKDGFSRMQGRLPRPVGGSVAGRFGQARSGGGTWKGVFFATASAGVRSVASGTVAYAGALAGYGNTVVVDHGGGYVSVYTGLNSIGTGSGVPIASGGHIGTSGTLPDGEQGLYFEIRYRNQPMNPLSWLR